MVDTCCDPTPIDFVIPANDDASKSISLVVDLMVKAINEGLEERKNEKDKEPTKNEDGDSEKPTRTRARKSAKAPKAKAADTDEKEAVEENSAEEAKSEE